MSADLDARDRYGLPPRADTPQMSPLARELTRLRELNAELVAALEAISSNPHCDLGSLVYKVRDSDLEGWKGPAVIA